MSTPTLPNPSPSRPDSRRRTRKACEPCRRRKKKCDGSVPCSTCQELRYICSYAEEEVVETPARPSRTTVPGLSSTDAFPPQDDNAPPQFIEPSKLRSVDRSSSIALPLFLAGALGSSNNTFRLHSYAFNLGIQDEQFFRQDRQLPALIDLGEIQRFAKVYFETVNPVFPLLEPNSFNRVLLRHWHAENSVDVIFEALVSYVVLLGSYFSWPNGLRQEKELVDFASSTVDGGFFRAPSLIQLNHVAVWTLRTIHARLTTRPNICWMASCITLHLCESTGLHKEWTSLESTSPGGQPRPNPAQLEHRRKLFWCAWVLNQTISLDYGRKPMLIHGVDIGLPKETNAQVLCSLVQIYQLIPCEAVTGWNRAMEQYHHIMDAVLKIGDGSGFILMAKAEFATGLFRRLLSHRKVPTEAMAAQYLEVEERGLEAVSQCLESGQIWWHIISLPFQYLCLAILLGSPSSLQALPRIVALLEHASDRFHSHLVKEALDTAKELVNLAVNKREDEIRQLRYLFKDNEHFDSYAQLVESSSSYSFGDLWSFEPS